MGAENRVEAVSPTKDVPPTSAHTGDIERDSAAQAEDTFLPFAAETQDEAASKTTVEDGTAEARVDPVTAQEQERNRVDFEYDAEGEVLSAIDRQYAVHPEIPQRIHILGLGSIGRLVAHSLRALPKPPPVTLLLHRWELIDAWEQSKKQITIHRDGFDVSETGFDVELMRQDRIEHGVKLEEGTPSVYDIANDNLRPHEAAQLLKARQDTRAADQPVLANSTEQRYAKHISDTPIDHLIITLKTPTVLNALSRLKHRIRPTTTVCFLQNGMGLIDQVNAKLFPDPTTRPNYAQGIITHGANIPPEKASTNSPDPFYAVHAGHGTISLGLLPRTPPDPTHLQPEKFTFPLTARHLLRTLTRSPVLAAIGYTPSELHQQQLEKLAVNSVINPLTTLLDVRNGSLVANFALLRLIRLLLAETSLIITSLPELKGIPNVRNRFSIGRLEAIVMSVAKKTGGNVSSMLADVRAGRVTEVEWINGYIVRRGEEMGVKAVVNYGIMQAVMGKAMAVRREVQEGGGFGVGGRRWWEGV